MNPWIFTTVTALLGWFVTSRDLRKAVDQTDEALRLLRHAYRALGWLSDNEDDEDEGSQ